MSQSPPADTSLFAFGIALPTFNGQGELLDAYFPTPKKSVSGELGKIIAAELANTSATLSPETCASLSSHFEQVGDAKLADTTRQLAESDQPLLVVCLAGDAAIDSAATAYLKLHLLSHRLSLPNSMNLEGIFAQLKNVAWTNKGAIDPAELQVRQLKGRIEGDEIEVRSIDKFPLMVNYVVPSGVRIADSSRVRLGAYVGEGTTIMHEGLMNFNTAALGPNMVEGRISQGVVVGAHSDLGGSSSTQGTLSGGGKHIVSLGEHCLIGANGGCGISLGDRCTIEAGLYITAGTPVMVVDETGDSGIVKARELSGHSDLLFIRNAQTGRVECRTNRAAIELNNTLHLHN